MDQTIILEAREAVADVNNAHGDWQTVLTNPVPLYPNDTISLKTAVLDTVNQASGSITIEETQTLTVSGIPYVVDFASNEPPVTFTAAAPPTPAIYNAAPQRFNYDPPVTAVGRPDFARYFLCQRTTVNNTNLSKLTSFTFHPHGDGVIRLSFAFTYTITYRDVNNVQRVDQHHLAAKINHSSFTVYDVNPIYIADQPITVEVQKWKGHLYAVVHGTPTSEPYAEIVNQTDQIIKPLERTVSFTLEKGVYAPDDLCKAINRGLTTEQTGASQYLNHSPFFFTTDLTYGLQINTQGITNGGNGYDLHNPPTWTKESPLATDDSRCIIAGVITPVPGTTTGSITGLKVQQPGYGFTQTLTNVGPTSVRFNFQANAVGAAGHVVNFTTTITQTAIFVKETIATFNAAGQPGDVRTLLINAHGEPNPQYVGASQVQMAYDPSINKFTWPYLHTPVMAGGAPLAQSVQIAKFTPATTAIPHPDPKYGVAGSIGGVALTALRSSSENVRFWYDLLGFNTDMLCKPKLQKLSNTADLTLQAYYYQMFPYRTDDDVHYQPVGNVLTDAFVGSDAVFVKKASANGVAYAEDLFHPATTAAGSVDTQGYFYSTVSADSTQAIEAAESTGDLDQDKSGYYLIDIDGIKQSALTSHSTSQSIQAIVSRYYNSGSYTTGDSSTGIIYQHKGAPQYMQSLRVRVLQPNGQLADDVGNDSAVFLQINRAPPQPKKG